MAIGIKAKDIVLSRCSNVIGKVSVGSQLVYSAGNIVTYVVDTTTKHIEEVDNGDSILSPTSFVPTKSGWTFIGWRTDTTANGTILSDAVMDDDPITLYAVFRQTISCKFVGYGNTQTVTGYRYYNNGTTANASITAPTVPTCSGWTIRGWSAAGITTADATVTYGNGSTISGLTTGYTYYGLYQQTITLSYGGNGNTSGSTVAQTGYRYYSACGNFANPSFTLRTNGFSKTSYTFCNWRMGSTTGNIYKPGATVTLTASTVFYAYWVLTVKSFGYNGNVQTFTAPIAGTYLLEVWGAQGGFGTKAPNCTAYAPGGYGGYAKGNVVLAAGQVLYVYVGGQGLTGEIGSGSISGGYNGGGTAARGYGYDDEDSTGGHAAGSGGGATHIAKCSGLLSSLSAKISNILIVAGAGGGGSGSEYNIGGAGGGTTGGAGQTDDSGSKNDIPTGGSQSSGGSGNWGNGSFGQGGAGGGNTGGAGGGGYYGGAGANSATHVAISGAGGSGYIGGVTSGSMTNGVQAGNGKANITLVSVA